MIDKEQSINSPAYKPKSLPPQHDASSPTGKTKRLPRTGTQVYIVNDGTEEGINADNPGIMVVLLTNSLGLASANNKRLADKYASKLGCIVAMPDLFQGEPVPTGGAILDDGKDEGSARETQEESLREDDTAAVHSGANQNTEGSLLLQVKTFAVSTVKGFLEDMWAARHTFSHTLPILHGTLQELTETYKPRKVVVVGYSFGAKYVLPLISSGFTTSEIMCGAVIHPSLLEPRDFKRVEKPLHLVYSKDDDLLPEEVVRRGLQILADRQKKDNNESENHAEEVEVTVYDNSAERAADINALPLPHGFAVPGDYPVNIVGDRPQKVFSVVTAWIAEHL